MPDGVDAPRPRENQARWLAAMDQRAAAEREALRASRLPECEWMAREAEALPPTAPSALLDRVQRMNAHADSCGVCGARARYLHERFGPIPDVPRSALSRLVAPIERLAPVPRGAAALAIVASAIAMLAVLDAPGRIVRAVILVLASACAGAAGVLVYTRARPALRRAGTVGDYITGVVIVGACGGCFELMVAFVTSTPPDLTFPSIAGFGAGVLLLGLWAGHRWSR